MTKVKSISKWIHHFTNFLIRKCQQLRKSRMSLEKHWITTSPFILVPPPRGIIFLTAVGQRHPRLRRTRYLKYCIQGYVNQSGRPWRRPFYIPQCRVSGHPRGSPTGLSSAHRPFTNCTGAYLGATLTSDWDLSEVSQAEKDTYYTTVTSTRNLKK